MPLIGLGLAEYRASPVEDEMSYGHDDRGFGVRSADIQMANGLVAWSMKRLERTLPEESTKKCGANCNLLDFLPAF